MCQAEAWETVAAEESHKSSCLSFCMFCSLQICSAAARTLGAVTKRITAGRRNHLDSKGEPPVMAELWWLQVITALTLLSTSSPELSWQFFTAHIPTGQSNEGWHVGKHCPRCPLSLSSKSQTLNDRSVSSSTGLFRHRPCTDHNPLSGECPQHQPLAQHAQRSTNPAEPWAVRQVAPPHRAHAQVSTVTMLKFNPQCFDPRAPIKREYSPRAWWQQANSCACT